MCTCHSINTSFPGIPPPPTPPWPEITRLRLSWSTTRSMALNHTSTSDAPPSAPPPLLLADDAGNDAEEDHLVELTPICRACARTGRRRRERPDMPYRANAQQKYALSTNVPLLEGRKRDKFLNTGIIKGHDRGMARGMRDGNQ